MNKGKYSYAYTDFRDASIGTTFFSYGTVIFKPKDAVTDFGASSWPQVHDKQLVCYRIILVSTWTDGKPGFVGGKSKAKLNESPIDTINREFREETGSEILFNDEDFCFAYQTENNSTPTFLFAKFTDDLDYFNSILTGFYVNNRSAYVNEVLSLMGYPIWIEGPPHVSEVSWSNNVWGLPRHLTCQGGMFTPTLGGSSIPREHFLAILHLTGILDEELVRRVFHLASATSFLEARPLPAVEDFLSALGHFPRKASAAATGKSDEVEEMDELSRGAGKRGRDEMK